MAEPAAFYGSATIATNGQIVIPRGARAAMPTSAGDTVVVIRGPRDSSITVSRVDSFVRLLAKAIEADREPAR
jgi:AbrB family looped-hinge helix DNA binding protein